MAVSNSVRRHRGLTLRAKPSSPSRRGPWYESVAEQARHLVVQVVARGQGVETFVQGHLVEEMPLDLAAGRADGTVEALLDQRDGQALGGQFLDHELQAVPGAEALHHAAGHGRGSRDAQVDVQAGDVIALPGKLQHQGQRILAARQGHQDAFVTGEELLAFDALFHLTGKELEVTVGTEGGVVAAQGHHGRRLADLAFQWRLPWKEWMPRRAPAACHGKNRKKARTGPFLYKRHPARRPDDGDGADGDEGASGEKAPLLAPKGGLPPGPPIPQTRFIRRQEHGSRTRHRHQDICLRGPAPVPVRAGEN